MTGFVERYSGPLLIKYWGEDAAPMVRTPLFLGTFLPSKSMKIDA